MSPILRQATFEIFDGRIPMDPKWFTHQKSSPLEKEICSLPMSLPQVSKETSSSQSIDLSINVTAAVKQRKPSSLSFNSYILSCSKIYGHLGNDAISKTLVISKQFEL